MQKNDSDKVTVIRPDGTVIICRPDQVEQVSPSHQQPHPFAPVGPSWPYTPGPSWPWQPTFICTSGTQTFGGISSTTNALC